MTDGVYLSPDHWWDAGGTTETGKQDNNDITNDVNVAIQSLNNALNAVGFMENAKNFVTAMEEFGQGMAAALACISVDMQVVASGVKAAATAFAKLDAELSSVFKQMEQQLSYLTNTTSSVTLAQPSAADQTALMNLLNQGSSSSYDPGIHLSFPRPDPTTTAEAGGVAVVALLFLGLLALA
ncbi:MAG TPA: hypothetical protein VHD63_13005 [Ktedonobacteraceae bacterium]|nr:hypothetical protein [Ktedonobacteraceae bacterium]